MEQGKGAWRKAGKDRSWWRALIIGLAVGLPVVALLPLFFELIEARPGVVPPEPVLTRFAAREVAVATFVVLYAGVLAGTLLLSRRPYALLRMLHAYAALLLLRMLTMYTFTLEPPAGIIPLLDPITSVFYPGGKPFLKDLFFSGHTATLVLFALAVGPGRWRWALGTAAVVVGALVLVQHVHYSIDVLAAPPFAWLAWWISDKSLKICGSGLSASEAA
jgi:hypothetical protein